jgi:hypothetical protein
MKCKVEVAFKQNPPRRPPSPSRELMWNLSPKFFFVQFFYKGEYKKVPSNTKGECVTIVGFCLHLWLPPPPVDELWWRARFHHWKLGYHAHVASIFLHSRHELLCSMLNMSSPSYSPPFLFVIPIAHCDFARFHNLLLKMHDGRGCFGGSLLELCNANMASRLWSPRICWTLLIKIINCATIHFHPWFIIHELFFHDWLQKCKFLLSSSLLITMVFFTHVMVFGVLVQGPLFSSWCNYNVHSSLKFIVVVLCTLQ